MLLTHAMEEKSFPKIQKAIVQALLSTEAWKWTTLPNGKNIRIKKYKVYISIKFSQQ